MKKPLYFKKFLEDGLCLFETKCGELTIKKRQSQLPKLPYYGEQYFMDNNWNLVLSGVWVENAKEQLEAEKIVNNLSA